MNILFCILLTYINNINLKIEIQSKTNRLSGDIWSKHVRSSVCQPLFIKK